MSRLVLTLYMYVANKLFAFQMHVENELVELVDERFSSIGKFLMFLFTV